MFQKVVKIQKPKKKKRKDVENLLAVRILYRRPYSYSTFDDVTEKMSYEGSENDSFLPCVFYTVPLFLVAKNKTNKVLYTGVTADLERRVYQHKDNNGGFFTQKYKCHKLVYFAESAKTAKKAFSV